MGVRTLHVSLQMPNSGQPLKPNVPSRRLKRSPMTELNQPGMVISISDHSKVWMGLRGSKSLLSGRARLSESTLVQPTGWVAWLPDAPPSLIGVLYIFLTNISSYLCIFYRCRVGGGKLVEYINTSDKRRGGEEKGDRFIYAGDIKEAIPHFLLIFYNLLTEWALPLSLIRSF